ncbi:MAG: hypothetical protein A2445_05435 [Candidatus Jacksonbacteria bacterium RIFOXYC2_FULL_44_29]|nr:MAG: Glycosyl transferase group 1 [Parcubacteria group bacterium GW2011_GWC2_44_22]OGY74704.1 MAG: hypothetical protein A2240_04935 [Candidatus Jacksonbacteria bacterium RIFOXYA2_FULL_43_12]OGY77215.1 MAG: hypothetical protein A2295_03585 [Candidatus Jacksonbacteria bacterium RIFOXYB2_FULL_44_15]OGY79156.1 MAG: hypothetical protein A2550_01275 [Candidatus Jacksonbacteria bacterium RIFOXYD2_FULL_43_21]OGY80132.1 MAG: hypothetical protein A2445_05435 [Candidatus Jacksonbacteria bacterium RIFOX
MVKVLMFGWEFPPFNSGGLGVACEGLARSLAQEGVSLIFVLPRKFDYQPTNYRLIFADEDKGSSIKVKAVNSLLTPYVTSASYSLLLRNNRRHLIHYSSDLMAEVARYAQEAGRIAAEEEFDVIHAHDWLSFPAGLEAKRVSGKPLIVHVHATEFDRTGGNNCNTQVFAIEQAAFEEADAIIAVSQFTKNKVIQHYGIPSEKIKVVHNAIEPRDYNVSVSSLQHLKQGGKKVVLFVGRITLQKGPDVFLRAARRVVDFEPNALFIIAGSGDMEAQVIREAAALGLADKVLFAGFLRGEELRQLYKLADLYVLPSVSEPFGITTLEALASGTPVIISKQSGVAEVIDHCLKVDFWDVNEMASKIVAVLRYSELQEGLKENGSREVKKFSWRDAARKCLEVYHRLLAPLPL